MSTNLTLTVNKKARINFNYPNQHYSVGGSLVFSSGDYLLVGFSELATQYRKRAIISAKIMESYSATIPLPSYSTMTPSLNCGDIYEPWDAGSVSYNTKPQSGYGSLHVSTNNVLTRDLYQPFYSLRYGVSLHNWGDNAWSFSTSPYIQIIIGDDNDSFDLSRSSCSPAAGAYISKLSPITFHISLRQTYGSYTPISADSGKIRYKFDSDGAVENTGTVSADGQQLSYTLPVAQIPNFTTLQYQWEVTDEFGVVKTSDWITLIRAGLSIAETFPADGYVMNRSIENSFEFTVDQHAPVNSSAALTVTSAQLQWRNIGETVNYNTISFPAGYRGMTVPENTFPAVGFQYRIQETDSEGRTHTTSWRNISTVDAISTCQAITPINTVEDGSAVITLRWQHNISTGTAQTAADIQTSADGSAWTDLTQLSGSSLNYDIPPNTLAAGLIFWRVRTYNADNVAGSWSESASFINVAAPAAPIVSASASPLPLISWQAVGQQAYRVQAVDYDSGARYGTDKSFRVPELLADGTYTARVQVQNIYGLWSAWGTYSFEVLNVPGEAISLTVRGTHQAELTWQSADEYERYRVYRNGKQIAELAGKSFTDIYSVGVNDYEIVGINDTFNYMRSNSVRVKIIPYTPMLCDIASGSWLALCTFAPSHGAQWSKNRDLTYLQVSGSRLPLVEKSKFFSESLNISGIILLKRKDRKQLESLIGQEVCLKTPEGDVSTGPLMMESKNDTGKMCEYSISVTNTAGTEAEYDTDD